MSPSIPMLTLLFICRFSKYDSPKQLQEPPSVADAISHPELFLPKWPPLLCWIKILMSIEFIILPASWESIFSCLNSHIYFRPREEKTAHMHCYKPQVPRNRQGLIGQQLEIRDWIPLPMCVCLRNPAPWAATAASWFHVNWMLELRGRTKNCTQVLPSVMWCGGVDAHQ